MGQKTGVHTEKVPGGKLVRVKVSIEENTGELKSVQVLGDFFLHPEDFVTEIEALLKGSLDEEEEKIAVRLDELIKGGNAQLIGVDAEAIARCFRLAAKNAGESNAER